MRHLLKKKKKRKEAILTSISLGFSILNIRKHGLCSFVTVTFSTTYEIFALLFSELFFVLSAFALPRTLNMLCL